MLVLDGCLSQQGKIQGLYGMRSIENESHGFLNTNNALGECYMGTVANGQLSSCSSAYGDSGAKSHIFTACHQHAHTAIRTNPGLLHMS
jgi:hypothetical protein